MTTPTQSVSVRQSAYAKEQFVSGSITPVLYDSQYDSSQNVDVLDDVLAYNPAFNVIGYVWNGIRQVQSVSTYHLDFDGVTNEITIPAASKLANLPTSNFTVEFDASIDKEATAYLLDKSSVSDGFGWSIYIFGENILFYFSADSYNKYYGITVPISNNNRHHYELSWNHSTGHAKAFIDGINITASEDDGGFLTGTYDADDLVTMSIAGANDGSQCLQSSIYWMMISSIVKHSSNFTPPVTCPAANADTVLRLSLDEGSGTIANDTSGNNNNGTIHGATWKAD